VAYPEIPGEIPRQLITWVMAKRAPARNSRPRISPEVFPMTAPAIPAPAKGRLGNGQLRRQVAEWLAARPGPHTVGEIAKDLGRSAGAVGNALTTLADRAEAARITGKPLRYEANSATRRRSRRHHPQGTLTAQVRLCRAVGRAEAAASSAPKAPAPKAAPGPVTRPGGQVFRPRVCSAVGRAKSRQQITLRLRTAVTLSKASASRSDQVLRTSQRP
jgi:hypothetical protein